MSRQHDRLRALNQPKPIHGRVDGRGRPIALEIGGRLRRVVEIQDRWRIDDEWWRKGIRRMYWAGVLEGGEIIVVFQDMIEGSWYRQTVSEPVDHPQPRQAAPPERAPSASLGTDVLKSKGAL